MVYVHGVFVLIMVLLCVFCLHGVFFTWCVCLHGVCVFFLYIYIWCCYNVAVVLSFLHGRFLSLKNIVSLHDVVIVVHVKKHHVNNHVRKHCVKH